MKTVLMVTHFRLKMFFQKTVCLIIIGIALPFSNMNGQQAGNSVSEIYTDANTVKEARKNPVFYYGKIDYSGFDRISVPAVTEPAVKFVLTLKVKFETE